MLLTAEEAAARLGITKRTLYAYVSRGLVPSVEGPGRERRYPAADVAALASARAYRRAPLRAAREALDFGPPLLGSSVTTVADGRFFYRGRDALALARTLSFESACALLWLGDPDASLPPPPPPPLPPALVAAAAGLPTVRRFEVLLAAADAAAPDPAAVRSAGGLARVGTALLALLVRAAGGEGGGPVAARLARAWTGGVVTAPLLDAALVLLADHELTPAALAARCAASVDASPYAAVRVGLAVLASPKYVGRAAAVVRLFEEAGGPAGLWETIRARRRRGQDVPGFGHRLYPEGDPRTRVLRDLLEAHRSESEGAAWLRSADAAAALTGAPPAVDLALVAFARALALPPEAPGVVFALARSAGLLAHAGEEYRAARPIRPRAGEAEG